MWRRVRSTSGKARTVWQHWCATPAPIRSPARFTSSGQNAHTAHHSTYRLGFARIAYPWHPLHGRRLRIGQRATRGGADMLLVAERDGTLRELPTWMCDEAACAAMTLGPPVVAVAALSELALVLAGLAATQSAPSSSGSRTTPESPHETSAAIPPEPTRPAPRARFEVAAVPPHERGADARAGVGRPAAVRARAASARKPDRTSDHDGGWR